MRSGKGSRPLAPVRVLVRHAQGVAAELLSSAFSVRDADDLLRLALQGAEEARDLLEDIQTAAWHLSGLPSRKDVRRLLRRTSNLSRKVTRLDRLLGELEETLSSSSGDGRL